MNQVRKWIKTNVRSKSRGKRDKSSGRDISSGRDKSTGRDKSKGRSGSNRRNNKNQKSPDRSASTARLIDTGLLDSEDDDKGWSATDMFKANEILSGHKVDYDGNPHVFAEQGFQGNDPHAFRVVGGTFMNSNDPAGSLAAISNQQEKYQPLVNTSKDGNDKFDVLQPFFSTQGATPWGDVVSDAKTDSNMPTVVETTSDTPVKQRSSCRNKADQELWSMLQVEGKCNSNAVGGRPQILVHDGAQDTDDAFWMY